MELKNIINQKNALLKSRFSVRKYDETVKISKEEMSNILNDAMTAPSSLNLQPWRFVVFHTEESKAVLQPYMMFNQVQWETSSAVIAIFGDMENFSYVDEIWSAAAGHNLVSQEEKNKMVGMIKEYRSKLSAERIKDAMLVDCGLITMQVMLAAKAYGYDTNPIGGYMKEELTEALGMDPVRYIPIMLVTIGKAAEDKHDSIRFSVDEITEWR